MSKASGHKKKLSLTLLFVSMLTIMVGAALAPSLPQISARIGLESYVSLILTLPAIGVVLSAPFTSRLIDRWGGKGALLLGLAFYGALGVIGAWLSYIPLLFLDRFLLGCATSLVMASGTSLIAEHYQGDSRLVMIARQGMAIEVGGVLFLSLSGAIAQIHWQLPFSLYMLAFIFIFIVCAWVPAASRKIVPSKVQRPSTLTMERDILGIATLSMLVFFVSFITLPHSLHVMRYSEQGTGFYLGFISLIAVISAGLMPVFRRRLAAYPIFGLAFVAYAAGHFLLSIGSGLAVLWGAAILLGTGFGLTIPLANYEIILRSEPAARNRNLAYLSSAIFLGQALSSLIEFWGASYSSIFLFAAGFSIIIGGVILINCLPRKNDLTLR